MRKNAKKWPVFHPHRFNAKSVNLETYARKLLYLLCIRMSDFVMIGPREHSQKCVTDIYKTLTSDGRGDAAQHFYICDGRR